MKIELEYPYNTDWKYGYIVTSRENRKTLVLFNTQKERTSTQFARYILAVSLRRYLSIDETVDHIDGNKTNDSLDNLQILSRRDNIKKSAKGIQVKAHGTLSMYRYCKCELCCKAKSDYMKNYSKQS